MKKNILFVLLIFIISITYFNCPENQTNEKKHKEKKDKDNDDDDDDDDIQTITYNVIYNGYGKTGGNEPVDSINYEQGATVTVLGAGTLYSLGYSFIGWKTELNGSGTNYTQGRTFIMGTSDVILYARWTTNTTYTVTYVGNGNTGGSAPVDSTNYELDTTAIALGAGTLVRTGYSFTGWNTKSDGSGTNYTQGQTISIGGSNITLYAKWKPSINYAMVTVLGMKNIPIGYTGASEPVHTVKQISRFNMGKYEVTYNQWYIVREWAEDNGYTFANAGREGHDGSDGAAPTAAKNEPVTLINWRDCIVWCNAASQYEGLTPVYYSDAGFTTPIKNSSNGSYGASINTTAGSFDNPYVNWSANGYRLPTEAEWETCARYQNGANWTPGNHASGDLTSYCYPSDGGTSTIFKNYAWYSVNSNGVTHDVGTKTANQLTIYDMSGNVSEWCWDWYGVYTTSSPYIDQDTKGHAYDPANPFRLIRGGSVGIEARYLQCSIRNWNSPYTEYITVGFRLVKD